MINDLTTIKQTLSRNKSDLAFIVGNGINRFAYAEEQDVSWNRLLLDVWEQITDKTLSDISTGISLTEFYDIMEFEAGSSENVKAKVAEHIEKWKPKEYHSWLQKKIEEWDVPLLTTNFDRNLDNGLRFNRLEIENRGFTDYYPWDVYFSNTKLSNPTAGFGVWHINGMVEYHRSIRLSLAEYMGLTARARSFLHKKEGHDDFVEKNQKPWKGNNTWLHIIFNRSLCILGLGLDENEIFLRWLLIERAKYFKEKPEFKKEGWYICSRNNVSEGKKFFLNYLGFELVELNNYDEIYKGVIDI